MVFTPPVPPGVARCNSFSTIKLIGAKPSCGEIDILLILGGNKRCEKETSITMIC